MPNFNPRSPCGERLVLRRAKSSIRDFNPRSPCGERLCAVSVPRPGEIFQSALPLRGATTRRHRQDTGDTDFNPRSPCGERPASIRSCVSALVFQSALPLRGATEERRNRFALDKNFNPRSPCGERPLHFVASIYYQQSVVFSKTVAANSVDKLRKTTAKSAITRCEPRS